MRDSAPAKSERYLALDSLRGVCAIIIVLFHAASTGILSNLAIVRNGFLFVDFFFVLSGFVIAASYGDRLAAGFPVGRFMFLRLGRVYPLHIAVLLAFLAIELIAAATGYETITHRPPFTGSRTLPAFLESVALVQIFRGNDELAWNWPSWSIAAEVWTYLLVALALHATGRPRPPAILAVAALCGLLVAIIPRYLAPGAASPLSLIRCLYGFLLGMFGHLVFQDRAGSGMSAGGATCIELAVVAACGVAATVIGHTAWRLACPPLFLVAVLIFAGQRGAVSALLKTRTLLFLGTLSYSIYMTHAFVLGRFAELLSLAGTRAGYPLVTLTGAQRIKTFSGPGLIPDVLTLIALAVVIAVAMVTCRFIELPSRRKSRDVVARWGAGGREQVGKDEASAPTF